MPFFLVRNDITRMDTDAIVNAANENLVHGGGVAAAIANAAGRAQMDAASAQAAPCSTGGAVWTPGFDLPAKYVIHAVGPVWRGGEHDEAKLLASAYLSALNVAQRLGCRSVAFPLISSGIFGFPQEDAFQIAVDTIDSFLETSDMDVYLVLFGSRATEMGMRFDPELDQFIDDAYAKLHAEDDRSLRFCETSLSKSSAVMPKQAFRQKAGTYGEKGAPAPAAAAVPTSASAPAPAAVPPSTSAPAAAPTSAPAPAAAPVAASAPVSSEHVEFFEADSSMDFGSFADAIAMAPEDLGDWLEHLDASFSDAVFSLIDAKGLTDPEVYKRVHMSRQAFAKLRQPGYHPGKSTAVVLAFALELDYEQTQELLARAGYTLSPSSMQDRVVEFFIRRGVWDLAELNHALWERDLPLLQQ